LEVLNQGDVSTNPYIKEVNITPMDFIKDPFLYSFYVDNVDVELAAYEAGHPSQKPDVMLNCANNKLRISEKKIEAAVAQINTLAEENMRLRENNKLLTERLRNMINQNVDKHKLNWKPGM
jgi:DNA-directed RNA polymerase subunit L